MEANEAMKADLIERLRNRAEQTSDYPNETLYCEAADELSALRERVATIDAALVHDPEWIATGVPDDAVEAGMKVFRQVDRDNENYVAGETTDWDEGMIVAAIFKAVARAILAKQGGEDVIANIAADLAAGRTESQHDG